MLKSAIALIALAPLALISCNPAPAPAVTPPPAPTAPKAQTAVATATATATAAPAPTATEVASATATVAEPPPPPPLPAVTLVQVEPVKPAGKPPVLGITAPTKQLVIPEKKAATFEVKLTAKEYKPNAGDHLCVMYDKRPCYKIESTAKPIRLGDLGVVDEGQHVISVVARYASGEFVRGVGKSVPFASVSFFIGKKVPPVHKDGAPMLYYSPPERGAAPEAGVLIDFFVANTEIKSGSAVLTASVGGPGIESGIGLAVEANKPLRLKNARPGEYISRMILMQFAPDLTESKSLTTVTYSAKQVPGPFGQAERSFVVTK
jgi:hypothetical protein